MKSLETDIDIILYHFLSNTFTNYAEKVYYMINHKMLQDAGQKYVKLFKIIEEFETNFERLPKTGELISRIEDSEVKSFLDEVLSKTYLNDVEEDYLYDITEKFIIKENIRIISKSHSIQVHDIHE